MFGQALIKRLFSTLLFLGGLGLFLLREAKKVNSNLHLNKMRTTDDAPHRQDTDEMNGFTRRTETSPVLLVTYMRSGSTFIGDVIQNSRPSRVYYAYEPLKYFVHDAYIDNQGIRFFTNGSYRTFPRYHGMMDSIFKFYNCHIDRLPQMFLLSHKSRSLQSYRQCREENSREYCITKAKARCRASSRVIKTIRMSISAVEYLMEKIPTLKVVHLLRDPRGILRSMKLGHIFGMKDWSEVVKVAKQLCNRMEIDSKHSSRLKARYPGRINAYLYEDIAEQPSIGTNKLLRFLGIIPDKNFNNWLHKHTSSGEKGGYFDTVRPNSALAANFWRKTPYMKLSTMKAIDNVCGDAYKYLGLRKVESEADIRNLNISIRYDVPLFEKT